VLIGHLIVGLGEAIPTAVILDTPDFERSSIAGFIDVKSVANVSTDSLPPARINDLRLTPIMENSTMILEWTAVGDDYDSGTGMFGFHSN